MLTKRNATKLLRILQSVPSCFILGAGASSSAVPLGHDLTDEIVERYADCGSWPVGVAKQDERTFNVKLTHRINKHILTWEEMLLNWKLDRMPSSYVAACLLHKLAYASFMNAAPINYRVFRNFFPSTIINYNLDGLAQKFCRFRHKVLDPHGTIPPGFGSPSGRELIPLYLDYNSDDVSLDKFCGILFQNENHTDFRLASILQEDALLAIRNSFVVPIIGYSFARRGEIHDDWISLDFFCDVMRINPKPIYILDPFPSYLQELLSERIKTKRVYPFPIFWNIFSAAIEQTKDELDDLIYFYNDGLHKLA